MAKAKREVLKVNEGYNLMNCTVEELIVRLSQFPPKAKLMMNNYNEGSMFEASGDLMAANLTINKRTVTQNDDGPINTAVIGFWHEGRMKVELGPKQQAEIDAEVAATK